MRGRPGISGGTPFQGVPPGRRASSQLWVACENGGMRPELSANDAALHTKSQPGLGDLAAEFFLSLGISEERYRSAKAALYLDPKCGCADRRRWLNELGGQLGVDGIVVKMARWMDRGRG